MADVAPAHRDDEAPADRRADTHMPIEKIVANPNQPRRAFDKDALQSLADSIREKGVLQPLIVRQRAGDNTYEIVAGERRWRAAQIAQLHELPVLVRSFTDSEVLEIAIIENIQRADLNAVEEARGYRRLMDQFGHTQEKLAEALSKSRSHIANMLRLLNLPDDVIALLADGYLTAGHARALITAENPSALARRVVAEDLSVRETEKLAKGPAAPKPGKVTPKVASKDADTRVLEQDLSANLGMKVAINHDADGERGSLTIRYATMDELDEICRILSSADVNVLR